MQTKLVVELHTRTRPRRWQNHFYSGLFVSILSSTLVEITARDYVYFTFFVKCKMKFASTEHKEAFHNLYKPKKATRVPDHPSYTITASIFSWKLPCLVTVLYLITKMLLYFIFWLRDAIVTKWRFISRSLCRSFTRRAV